MTVNDPALRDSAFLEAFLDLVIPPADDGRLPGAGSLGLGPEVAAALEADATLGALVQAGLEAVRTAARAQNPAGLAALSPQDGVALIEAQLAAHPLLMMGVCRYLYTAYYQHPRVLEGLGEPPRPPFPEGFELEPIAPHLLEKLQARAIPPVT